MLPVQLRNKIVLIENRDVGEDNKTIWKCCNAIKRSAQKIYFV